MDDQKPMNYMDSQRQSLRERIQSMKVRSVEPYYKIVIDLNHRKGATLNEVVQDLKSKPQNEHSRLDKLIKIGVVKREKRGGGENPKSSGVQEFYYYISPEISEEEIEEIKKLVENEPDAIARIVLSKNTKYEQEINNLHEVTGAMETKLGKTEEDDSPNKLSLKEKIQMRLSMLPEFDPSWPPAAQQAWFQAIKRLENMQ
uniref:hypothetical protein n=1 Tax=Trichocoleus desertorum TaxID=1481672 RepID=UPI0025B56DF5|nr:hypothetical protein [Trichocoleus desertorum]